MQKLQGDRDFMAGFGKGLAVIECFDDRHPHLTIAQVAQRTGLSRAAARRCLLTLQRLGYASFNDKFFTLTPRVLRLGYAYLSATDLPQLIQPFLERLSEELQESCSATVLDGAEIVYIARSAKKRVMSVSLGVGSRLPAFCTSMGRVLLAALEPDEAIKRLAASERRKFTPHTCTRLEDLTDILRLVRRQGYCVTDQELEIGLVSMAVPIMDAHGETLAAINVGAQSARIAAADMPGRFLASFAETQKAIQPLLKGRERGLSWR
jgi:IclR family pca regulon transcriptional regulator